MKVREEKLRLDFTENDYSDCTIYENKNFIITHKRQENISHYESS